MQRHAVTTLGGSDRLWAHGFRVFFTPLSEVLFTFPSRYSFAIGLSVVFSLAGWPLRIQPGFLVSRPTQVPPAGGWGLRVRGFHPLRYSAVPAYSADPAPSLSAVPQPRHARRHAAGLGSSPFARRYWGIVLTFSSCGYLDVSVPHVRLRNIAGCRDCSRRVAPFGHPRVKGYLLLAVAFRSLSRPSSPPRAKGIPHAPLLHSVIRSGRKAFGLFSPKPFVPSPTNGDGARCVLLSFLLVFLAAGLRNLSPFACRFHHVNVLFPK